MPEKTLEQVVAELDRYPVDAFDFLRDGLQYTVHKAHGEPSELERRIQEWMAHREITIDKLAALYENAELPDNVSSVAFSLMVNASGLINAKTTVLLTPEEVDQATKKTVDYRPPGQ